MFKKNTGGKAVKGATLIAENTRISGDVHFSDQLFVNGCIDGNVTADADGTATLVISEVGTIKGEIKVPFVVINGTVVGDVHAGTRVELAAAAKISGNVYYKLIEMQLGAMVDGQLVHVANDGTEKASVHPIQRDDDKDPLETGAEAKVN
jgi:cytoskeletal protein CcmA (bactofilin family)